MELHLLGYVHRDLKPENVVLNLLPLTVRVIDFDRATLETTQSKGTFKGTPGYVPNWKNIRDGEKAWDVFSIGAIILEADLQGEEYHSVNKPEEIIRKAKQYLLKSKICPHIKEILQQTLLAKEPKDMMKID